MGINKQPPQKQAQTQLPKPPFEPRLVFSRGSRCSMVWCNYEVLQRKEFLGLANLFFFVLQKNPKVWPPLSVDRGVVPNVTHLKVKPLVPKVCLSLVTRGKNGENPHPQTPNPQMPRSFFVHRKNNPSGGLSKRRRPNSAESVRGWHDQRFFEAPEVCPTWRTIPGLVSGLVSRLGSPPIKKAMNFAHLEGEEPDP